MIERTLVLQMVSHDPTNPALISRRPNQPGTALTVKHLPGMLFDRINIENFADGFSILRIYENEESQEPYAHMYVKTSGMVSAFAGADSEWCIPPHARLVQYQPLGGQPSDPRSLTRFPKKWLWLVFDGKVNDEPTAMYEVEPGQYMCEDWYDEMYQMGKDVFDTLAAALDRAAEVCDTASQTWAEVATKQRTRRANLTHSQIHDTPVTL